MSLQRQASSLVLKNKHLAIQELISKTTHDIDYYVLLIGAGLLAVCAIFTDSIPTLIASMIVAPLAYPILLLGLGIVAGSWRLVKRALVLLLLSCTVILLLSLILTAIFGSDHITNRSISFSANPRIAIEVALISGAIAAFGLVRPKVASAITGVAIAVSLMPPLVDIGVGIMSDAKAANDAILLFLLNVLGILIASILVFSWFGMGKAYRSMEIESSHSSEA